MRVVTWNVATIDGRIAVSASVPAWLDDRWEPISKAGFNVVDVHALHSADVALGGSNSFVPRDAPSLDLPAPADESALREDFLPEDIMTRTKKWMVVIDSRGRVGWTQTQGEGAYLLVLVSHSTPAGYLVFLQEQKIPYLIVGKDRVELPLALRRLDQMFQPETVIVDAGGILNGALLRQGLVDEIDLQILPVVLGLSTAPAIFEGYDFGSEQRPLGLKPIAIEPQSDGSIFFRFTVGKSL